MVILSQETCILIACHPFYSHDISWLFAPRADQPGGPGWFYIWTIGFGKTGISMANDLHRRRGMTQGVGSIRAGPEVGDMSEGRNKVWEQASLHQTSAQHGATPAMAIRTVHIHRPTLLPLLDSPL